MKLDGNRQAIVLLSAHFSPSRRGDPTPLSPTEYGTLSAWLHESGFEPKDLLSQRDAVWQNWTDLKGGISRERLEYLLGRGLAMGIALEKWSSAGIWIITRADPEYPDRLRKKLSRIAPAVFFGVGNKALMSAGGLGIVGSRSISAGDEAFTREIARNASMEGLNIVSGGAKGVDETAMLAALEADGTALGVLASGLMGAALSGKWRPYLKRKDLCLCSPYYPDAAFHVGNAMARNKYIYCLSDYALVVRSEKGTGGTWAGATEAIRKAFSPVFVKPTSDAEGNRSLIELGAIPLEKSPSVEAESPWLVQVLGAQTPIQRQAPVSYSDTTDAKNYSGTKATEVMETSSQVCVPPSREIASPSKGAPIFFAFFVEQLMRHLREARQVSLSELKEWHPDITPKQMTDWLKRAVDENVLERRGKSHIYTMKSSTTKQPGLFDAKEP
jgi:predicted Rossmann fold nucleotide-binding protein DprA/Smf involved in DNA uptake